MNSREQAIPDAEVLDHDLDDRGQRVGRAARQADDLVFPRVERVEVDARQQYRIAVFALLARRADQYALGAGVEMGLGTGTRGRPPGAVDHEIDTKGLPVRQRLRRVEVRDLATADDEAAVFRGDLLGPAAVVGIDFEKRCQRRDVPDVGDGHGDKQLVLECHPHQ